MADRQSRLDALAVESSRWQEPVVCVAGRSWPLQRLIEVKTMLTPVLATFFPRWKAGAGWRCTNRGSRGQTHGHCDVERRIIAILFVSEDDDALDMLLIHEISHVIASLGYGKTWQRRLALVAATARKLGRTKLAELLDAEIDNYRNRSEGLADIYSEVQDALFYNPDLTLAQIKRWLGQQYGLRFGEIGKVFRGLRTVYEKGRKEGLEFRHDREEGRKEWQQQ